MFTTPGCLKHWHFASRQEVTGINTAPATFPRIRYVNVVTIITGGVGDTELHRSAHTESSPSSESTGDTVLSHSKAIHNLLQFSSGSFQTQSV